MKTKFDFDAWLDGAATIEFWVSLIHCEPKTREQREELEANCRGVGDNLWLFEGDVEAMVECYEIVTTVHDGAVVPAHGDLEDGERNSRCPEPEN